MNKSDGCPLPTNGFGNENEREGESARMEEDSKAAQIILSVFRFEREQSNFARVSETAQLFRILSGDFSPFFSLFSFFFFLIENIRNNLSTILYIAKYVYIQQQ